MSTVTVALHVHAAPGSQDSRTPVKRMIQAYRAHGVDAIGFVGHDHLLRVHSPNMITFAGIEHTVDSSRKLHVVEYPDHNFSVLAHPSWPFDHPVSVQAARTADKMGLNAVERWNAGVRQYASPLQNQRLVEVGGDDAHYPGETGLSLMRVPLESGPMTGDWLMHQIKDGKAYPVNTYRALDRVGGKLTRAAYLLASPPYGSV